MKLCRSVLLLLKIHRHLQPKRQEGTYLLSVFLLVEQPNQSVVLARKLYLQYALLSCFCSKVIFSAQYKPYLRVSELYS